MTVRLRQIALVAAELEPAVASLCEHLGVEVCFRDPGVGEFGLVNALMVIGDQFLEVVCPQRPGTTAGRLLDKRGGDGGYMVIVQAADRAELDRLRARLPDLGVRVVWQADHERISGTHLHPKDIGGAIVSVDAAEPAASWAWAGDEWQQHVRTDVVSAICGVVIGAHEPTAMAARWADVLHVPMLGDTAVALADCAVSFVPAGPRGEGLDALELTATDRSTAGTSATIAGIELRLV